MAAVEKYNITHPVMMDNDHAYWNALHNRYWPAFYLVNRKGNIVQGISGEMHEGTERAKVVEEIIERMLEEA